MKIHRFLLLLMAFSSCTQLQESRHSTLLDNTARNTATLEFKAYIDAPVLTRTVISAYENSYKTSWGKGDQISINADPSYFALSGGTESTVFITSNPSDVKPSSKGAKYVAHYPLSMFAQNTGAPAYLPEVQTRPFGAVPTLPMIAVSDSPELHFKYVAGLLKIHIATTYGTLPVVSTRLTADKALSGNIDATGDAPVITSDFGDIVSLTDGMIDSKGSEMFFTVPEGSYSSFELILTDNLGAYVSYSLGPLQMKAGQFREMSIVVNPEEYIPDNCIFYTTSDGSEITPFNMEPTESIYGEKGMLVFPKNVTTITSNAFDNTEGYAVGTGNLKTIAFPKTLATVGNYAFRNCASLEELVFPDNGKMVSIGASLCLNCSSLKKVSLPSSLSKINNNAFQNCISLREINIPPGIVNIPQNTFAGCSSLSDIVLPEGLTTFGVKAFMGTALTGIVIPEGVSALSTQLFQDCACLKKITLKRFEEDGGITTFANNALKNCSSLESIVVPQGAGDTYRTAEGWSAFAALITEEQ